MSRPIATNKKAYQNFFLSDNIECGIALTGGEVKSIRAGEVNFADSFARMEEGELYLYSLHIAPYAQASYLNDDPDRKRKLLLHKSEVKRLIGLVAQKKVTLIPTKIYINKRGFIKVELALARGKKLYDKREDIKQRDIQREVKRATKAYKK